ncbi:ABC transporter ATP-binding protein [Chitinophaga nivalis]|uniref:ABC transporter ATP-binding protein n=1 Tax=Chitinophaga nivalis TaxID=2991709 RepID=A0ABT3IMY8_9BACT|nr:ABC transporter ATP-binding protein [Chitinophaga nivalis]MCW3465000.1 ABC transporter ATP-binding protein [Chitinophaga nivalis]MCW3485308.1 ABC transporter ATP-binding protein [Chitinophaga nivalis]
MTKVLIELKQVSKTYETAAEQVHVLRDLSCNICYGDFLVIAGASGSGKSTLLNIIGCIDKPSSGNIVFAGKDITAVRLEDLNLLRLKNIGYVFQSFNLIPVLSGYENVEFPLLFSSSDKKAIREKAEQMLVRVGLGNRMHYVPARLSGGQRQRVAIARALAGNPLLVIADEPTASLDADTAVSIVQLLKDLNEEYGVTIVLATHDPLIMRYASTKLFLKEGHLVDAH